LHIIGLLVRLRAETPSNPILPLEMDLFLTNHANVRNTNFCNLEGQVIYKSVTPGSVLSTNRTTTISKIIPNTLPDDMVDEFTELAAIEWHISMSSRLKYHDIELPMKDFMPSEGVWGQHRVFTALTDGRSFRWTLGIWTSTLELDDSSKTPVARSHRSDIGILGKPRQARLEIFHGFEDLVDIILITFIFVEKLRKERERAGHYCSLKLSMTVDPMES